MRTSGSLHDILSLLLIHINFDVELDPIHNGLQVGVLSVGAPIVDELLPIGALYLLNLLKGQIIVQFSFFQFFRLIINIVLLFIILFLIFYYYVLSFFLVNCNVLIFFFYFNSCFIYFTFVFCVLDFRFASELDSLFYEGCWLLFIILILYFLFISLICLFFFLFLLFDRLFFIYLIIFSRFVFLYCFNVLFWALFKICLVL